MVDYSSPVVRERKLASMRARFLEYAADPDSDLDIESASVIPVLTLNSMFPNVGFLGTHVKQVEELISTLSRVRNLIADIDLLDLPLKREAYILETAFVSFSTIPTEESVREALHNNYAYLTPTIVALQKDNKKHYEYKEYSVSSITIPIAKALLAQNSQDPSLVAWSKTVLQLWKRTELEIKNIEAKRHG